MINTYILYDINMKIHDLICSIIDVMCIPEIADE
jgi:hypothetical protein